MKLSWQRRVVHTRHPFNIARTQRETTTQREALLVQLEHDDCIGWGEAAPVAYYNQTIDSNEAVLAEAADKLGDDPFALEVIHDKLWARFADQPAAIAAIDIALHDLIGKLLGCPVWRLFGLDSTRMPTSSFTIGIDDLKVIDRKVREAAGFPILKVKLGTSQDEEILQTIRDAAGDRLIRIDANCGWKPETLLENCRMVARFGVELVEQPLPVGDAEALTQLVKEDLPPVIADENCLRPDDVLRCRGLFDGINIKLCKCGGIRPALEMIHSARSAGLKIMLGCMVETSVGIAAAAQLAPLVDYVDLDGHLLLADDPFQGIGGAGGRLTLSDRPGLGVVERIET